MEYTKYIKSSTDLVTLHEATRAGFLAIAFEKNLKATPFVKEAKTLKVLAAQAGSPKDLLTVKKIHPAMFPILLPEMCIKLHGLGKKPLVVLDPFMGVGTTARAARNLGCDYVGFEIDEKYLKIALKLLKE